QPPGVAGPLGKLRCHRRHRAGPYLRLVRPVTVTIEVVARLVLAMALAVTGHPDAVEQVQQPNGEPGADDHRAGLGFVGSGDDRDQAAEADQRGQDPPDEQLHVMAFGSKCSTSSSMVAYPPSPKGVSSSRRTSSGDCPSAARSASVTAPWRLARRAPSGPSISGTCAKEGARPPAGSPSCSPSQSWRGVESRRSAPRTTSPIPWSASSTTTARL